jgi:SAM-dependent methyltransferase
MLNRLIRLMRSWPTHPIDTLYGIETSRKVLPWMIRTGNKATDEANIGYAGAQPSILRVCLELLPDVTGASFIDLGCGKGRMLATATEYPFKSIIGVELSSSLCRAAERNVEHVAKIHPLRTKAVVIRGNATHPPLPVSGVVVLFLNNPFRAPLVGELITFLGGVMSTHPTLKIFLIYYNPVHAWLMDKTPTLFRFYAAKMDFRKDERGSTPFGNEFDSVVIWQNDAEPMAAPHFSANRPVVVTVPDYGADVQH